MTIERCPEKDAQRKMATERKMATQRWLQKKMATERFLQKKIDLELAISSDVVQPSKEHPNPVYCA